MDLDLTHAEALCLIDKAVMAIQSTYSPGRPAFSALERVHRELMRARFEVTASCSSCAVVVIAPPR